MNFSRQFLLGVLALGLQAGVVSALEPTLPPVNNPPCAPPTLPTGSAAAPANSLAGLQGLPVGIAPLFPAGLTDAPTPPWCNAPAQPCCAAGSHGPSCCDCGSAPGGIMAGIGLYLVQPYVSNNPAYLIQNTVGRGPGVIPTIVGTRANQTDNITEHMEVAPLFWLGYLTDDGWGGRVRYWYFREGTGQLAAPTPGAVTNIESAAPLGNSLPLSVNSGMEVTSELEMQLLDLEGVEHLQAGHWDLLVSGGLRLMRVAETYNAYNTAALLSNRTFEGIGPTLALEARRPFGGSGLAFYTSARGSVAFGSADQNLSIPAFATDSHYHEDRGIPIGELEFGVEYARQVGRARLFAQIALVGQDWSGVGDASGSTIRSLPGGAIPGQGTGAKDSGGGFIVNSDIDLFGLSLRIGVNY